MESFLKKETRLNLISTLAFLIIGIILLSCPVATLTTISYMIEFVLVSAGIITIINYIRVESKNDVFSLGFVQGVFCILLALFLISNPNIVVSILPVVIGIWMLFGSLARIQSAIKLSSWGQKTSIWYIFLAILMFTIGIIAVCNPFATATVMVQMLGIAIIVYSALDIIQAIGILTFLKKIK